MSAEARRRENTRKKLTENRTERLRRSAWSTVMRNLLSVLSDFSGVVSFPSLNWPPFTPTAVLLRGSFCAQPCYVTLGSKYNNNMATDLIAAIFLTRGKVAVRTWSENGDGRQWCRAAMRSLEGYLVNLSKPSAIQMWKIHVTKLHHAPQPFY